LRADEGYAMGIEYFMVHSWTITHSIYDNWRICEGKFELLLFFDFIDSVPKIRKLSCSFQEKGNYFLKILLSLDISTIEVYMTRKHSPLMPKECFRPAQQLLF
jgi:hypothetical protein